MGFLTALSGTVNVRLLVASHDDSAAPKALIGEHGGRGGVGRALQPFHMRFGHIWWACAPTFVSLCFAYLRTRTPCRCAPSALRISAHPLDRGSKASFGSLTMRSAILKALVDDRDSALPKTHAQIEAIRSSDLYGGVGANAETRAQAANELSGQLHKRIQHGAKLMSQEQKKN